MRISVFELRVNIMSGMHIVCESESFSVVSDSLWPHGIVHGLLQARILDWVAVPFSSGSSKCIDWTQVSCTAGSFFTSWVTREPKNTGVGSLSLLQWIFLTWELNRDFLLYRQIFYQMSYKGSQRILEWVAYPFSSGPSWPRNRPGVSCIAGGFFTNWVIREALYISSRLPNDFDIKWPYENFPCWLRQ